MTDCRYSSHSGVRTLAERADALGVRMLQFNSGSRANPNNGFRLFVPVSLDTVCDFFDGNHVAHYDRLGEVSAWLDGYAERGSAS